MSESRAAKHVLGFNWPGVRSGVKARTLESIAAADDGLAALIQIEHWRKLPHLYPETAAALKEFLAQPEIEKRAEEARAEYKRLRMAQWKANGTGQTHAQRERQAEMGY